MPFVSIYKDGVIELLGLDTLLGMIEPVAPYIVLMLDMAVGLSVASGVQLHHTKHQHNLQSLKSYSKN